MAQQRGCSQLRAAVGGRVVRLATGGAECNTSAVLSVCCTVHRLSPARLFTCISRSAPPRPPPAPLQYKLNERSVGWEQYNRRLEQYNILVKARNFLVFQVGAAGVPATSWPGLLAELCWRQQFCGNCTHGCTAAARPAHHPQPAAPPLPSLRNVLPCPPIGPCRETSRTWPRCSPAT